MLILEIAGGILLAYIALAAVVGVAMWREQKSAELWERKMRDYQ